MHATTKESLPETTLTPDVPRAARRGHESVDMKKGLTVFPLVRPWLWESRLPESNRRPSRFARDILPASARTEPVNLFETRSWVNY
jgi:hypothetical protein